MKNHFYVYIYLNPMKPGNFNYGKYHFDFEPFYVGKGQTSRIYSHLKEFDKGHKSKLIKKILKNDFTEKDLKQNYILKIQDNLLEFCAFGLEKFMIKLIGRYDLKTGPLTNLTDGGDGNYGYKHTKETKKKLAKLKLGTHHTEDSKRKIGESNKGKHNIPCSNKIKKYLSKLYKGKTYEEIYGEEKAKEIKIKLIKFGKENPFYGKEHNDNTKKNISDSLKEYYKINGVRECTEETRKKLSDINKGKPKSEETKLKLSLANLGKKANIETLKKISDNSKNRKWINNNINEKSINKNDLNYYLEQGWKEGRIDFTSESSREKNKLISSGTKFINNGSINKKVKGKELENLLKEGWVFGILKNKTI